MQRCALATTLQSGDSPGNTNKIRSFLMMKRTTALLALGTAVSLPAFASESDVGRTYVTPMIGALRADTERPTDRDNVLGGLAIGRHLSEAWSAELMLNGTALDGETP